MTGAFVHEHVLAASKWEDVAVLNLRRDRRHRFQLEMDSWRDEDIPVFEARAGRSPIPHTTWLLSFFQIRRALAEISRRWGWPDLVHTQDHRAFDVVLGLGRTRLPIVISQHATAFIRRRVSPAVLWQSRWAFRRAQLVLLANKFGGGDLDHYRITCRSRWLPNALNTTIFHSDPTFKREPWLLHASSLTSQKRFPDLLQAFAALHWERPEIRLHVVGEGPNRKAMENRAAQLLPAGSYFFHGQVPKTELADWMRRSAGFVFPSEFETFGCVLMEAMACGCPVLTTWVGGIPGVVDPGEALFVDVGDIDRLVCGMKRLVDGNHGIDCGAVSRRISRQFSREVVGEQLHQAHLEAVGFEPPRGGLSTRPGWRPWPEVEPGGRQQRPGLFPGH